MAEKQLDCTLAAGEHQKSWLAQLRKDVFEKQRVFAIWAKAFGSECVFFDNPRTTQSPPRWWELSRHRWHELFEEHRLKFTVGQLQNLIKVLERITGRQFQIDRLHDLMERVNRQEEYFEEARQIICSAPRTPVRMHEQVTNVMATQWERGGDWAVEPARTFRDEIRNRVSQGVAACPGERLRLMWVGVGLWHDTDFYTAFEEEFAAVFVWSMYLAFGPDGYVRYGLDNPLLALAGRTVSMNEQFYNPPWANEWIVYQARQHRIDAALVLTPLGTRPAATGNRFMERALEEAGIPVFPVVADMVDARGWDRKAMRRKVSEFLTLRVLPDAMTGHTAGRRRD
jgi:benzoyl-CoA reductase subunit B